MPARAAAFIAGAWWLQQQAVLPGLLWAYLLPVAAFLLALLGRVQTRPARIAARLLWMPCWAIGGFLLAALWAHMRLADALPLDLEGRDVRVRGVIAEVPQKNANGTLRFAFDVEAIAAPYAHVPARINLSWYALAGAGPARPLLLPGQRWQLTVRLRRPHATANPHAADLERWFLERGVRAVGYVRPDAPRLLDASVAAPHYRIERLRHASRARIEADLAGMPVAGVLAALAIGDQQAIDRDQWRVFTATGVNHLMSISGLHITMLGAIAFWLALRVWARVPALAVRVPAQRAAIIAGLSVGSAYALFAGFGVPARRTVLMMAVMALALWSGRMARGRDVLALAALAVVGFDPWAVVSPGFWLSFGAVAIIMLVAAGRVHPGHWLLQWGRVQWAITIGLVPLMLGLFQQTSLVSPIANAAAVPMVSLAVVPATLAGLLLPGDWLLGAAAQFMQWTWDLLAALAKVPLATWSQAAPPGWAVIAGLAGSAWLLAPAGTPARWLGLGACLPLLLPPAARPATGEAWLDVIDVGQGQAVLVRTHAHALLYDAGPAYSGEGDAGSRIVVPHLRALGVRGLDRLIVSHDDNDHSGGADSVLDAVPVKQVLSSASAFADSSRLNAPGQRCARGQSWTWDGVGFDVLHPDSGDYNREAMRDNDMSCVLRVRSTRHTALLSGDIERASEAALLRRAPRDLRADVLLAPHHGSATSSSIGFLRHVQPRIAIFTLGHRNRFGHPASAVVERYAGIGAASYRSDHHGAIEVRMGRDLGVRAWRATHRRYWQGR